MQSEPLENGWVECQSGHVMAVGTGPVETEIIELGDVAIMPGLVNAHTHLEFSDLSEPLGDSAADFADWIRAVMQYRSATEANDTSVMSRGLAQSHQGGAAAVGEITTLDDLREINKMDSGHVVSFREFIGLSAEQVPLALQQATWHIQQGALHPWHSGLSPHAPYTVHGELLAGLCSLSALHQVPVAMHLAETLEEQRLLQTGQGPLRELLEELQVWDADAVQSPGMAGDYLPYLARCWRATVVHGNYLHDEDWQVLAARRESLTAAFCPRTHAYFQHQPYALEAIHKLGVRVAIGTDSRASNPDLSMVKEVSFVRRQFPQMKACHLLRMATRNGAYALGLEDRVGLIAPGALSSLLVIPCSDQRDVYEQVITNLDQCRWLPS